MIQSETRDPFTQMAHNLERFFISLLLQSKPALDMVKGKVCREDLYDEFHSRIFATLMELPSDTLWEAKNQAACMGLVYGTSEYDALLSLWNEAFLGGFNFKGGSNGNAGPEIVEDTITHVLNGAKRRFVSESAAALSESALLPTMDLGVIEADIEEMHRRLCAGSGRKTWSERTMEWYDLLQERYEHRNDRISLGTGMPTIDRLISRFSPGELIIVAAKRKVGKSAFMVGIVDKASVTEGMPGLVITLEMGASEWLDRLFAHRTRIDSQAISEGKLLDNDFTKINLQCSAIKNAHLAIEDTDCFTSVQIESLIRYYRLKSDIRYAIVDHAQLVQFPSSKNAQRSDELDKLGSKLKTLAQRLGITIFLLSQTNDRGVTFGASMLEAHLTKLIRLEIPEDEPEHTNKRYVNLVLNRSGKTGGVEAIFDGATCSFKEITPDAEYVRRDRSNDA